MKHFYRWKEYSWKNPEIDWRSAKIIAAGIDVGSVSSQAAIIVDGCLYAYSNIRTGAESSESAKKALLLALKDTGLDEERIDCCVGTGYGRVNVPMAKKTVTEIACHAKGAIFIYGPNVRTVIDIGGQDIKVIRCDEKGKVKDFILNDKCAAGTGRGIEVIAELFKIPVEKLGEMSLRCKTDPEPISDTCVVYARSEAINLLKKGHPLECVLASYLKAMAIRIYSLAKKIGIEPELAITGGIAKNKGIVERIKEITGLNIPKPRFDPQIAGAIGAALFAYEMCKR